MGWVVSDLTEAFLAKSRAQRAVPLATRSRRPRRAALVAVDAALILIGFAIAYWMRYIVDWPPPFEQIVSEVATQNFVPLAAFMPISLLLLAVLLVQFTMKG